ncbi:MAG: alpha-ketoacid dehydrogenase subunit beta [Microthrixaceae bacterium]|nr:alpha-ketoacid dehydrogenase subunit beta [Microthrixaceae bacterium]
MSTLTYREALREGMRAALAADERVFLMGEDVGLYGGCFAVSLGLLEEFGPERILDTPLSESAFVGAGIGAALAGQRPIVEIMTVNFSLLALDQILNNAATMSHMSGGQFHVPLVIRMTTGAGRQLAAQHSHSLEAWYAHIPGLRVVTPATVADAAGMLLTALEDPDPVLIFEHGGLFSLSGSCPMAPCPLTWTRQPSCDRVTTSPSLAMAQGCTRAWRWQHRWPTPWTWRSSTSAPCVRWTRRRCSRSVGRTGRLVVVEEGWRSGGIGAELAARAAEHAFWDLDAPVERVATAEVPIPYAKHLEDAALPSVQDVTEAVRRVMQ